MSQEYPAPETPVDSISSEELRRRLDSEPVSLLDVRNRDAIEAWEIESTHRTDVPYMKFLAAEATDSVGDLVGGIDEPVVVVCARGEASAYVASLLLEAGIEATNLAGGMDGWARLYESHIVNEDPLVLQYDRPSSGCLAYLVVSDGEAAVVDPLRAFVDRYRADAAEHDADLVYAVDTHLHADHVSGLEQLAEQGVEPVTSVKTAARGIELDVLTVDDGESLTVGTTTLEAIATPGHTSGMTSFRVDDLLFTGDGLFIESVPRPDLEAGADGAPDAARTLYWTLTERFTRFDDETRIAPGHYDPSRDGTGPHIARLGYLRTHMAVFDTSEDEFVAWVLDDMPPRPNNAERIVAINSGDETPSDDDAFELELGPNNCAAN
jgi:glyoxylase-like metal-dependent hydrolase (beta-lactamase superfamily II)/rhodanese-related sulfurtransferase